MAGAEVLRSPGAAYRGFGVPQPRPPFCLIPGRAEYNKQVWGTLAGRKAAALWARAAATKRGFEPGTTKTVPIVLDGAQGLKQNLEPLFAGAICTLDVCHVVEKLGLQSTLRPRGRPRKSGPATI